MADKKIMVQGTGPSKTLNDPNPANQKDPLEGLAGLHINGEPIEEWAAHMPADIVQRMSFPLTDEGQKEQAKIARERHMRLPVTGEIARDQDDKKAIIYREGLKTGNLVMGQDPLEIAMRENLPEGHSGLWIGPRKEKENGLVRGVLKFEPVLVKNPKTGNMERVMQNGMYLASVPIAAHQAAEQYDRDKGEARLQKSVETVQEQVDRLPGMTDRIRARSASSLEGITVDDADAADAEMAPVLMHESA